MAKGLPYSNRRGAVSLATVRKLRLKVTNAALQVDGATGIGFGTAVIGDFPEGNISILAAVSYLQFTTAAAGVTATFTGNYSLGTTPTADSTLDTTDVNIIASAAIGAATAKVSPVTRGISAAPAAPLDNTDGSLEVNLNLIIADATISADDVDFTVSGVVEILYSVLLDD